MNKPRISVYVITYNQEDVIRRTMDSLLKQKDEIYEICINDDCSKDGTFDILKEYEQQYPGLVKPVQNEHNLGIFANTEAVMAQLTGDVIYDLSGDDVCPDGYFEAILDYIDRNQIDWRNELFCIYGDYLEMEPDGTSMVYSNRLVKNHDALKLKVRKLLSIRSACYSKKVLDKFQKVSDGHSFSAEAVQDCQLALFADKNYYIPLVGNVYYAGIGVSTRMNKKEHEENIEAGYNRLIEFVEENGHPLDRKDLAFINFLKVYRTGDKKKMLLYYLKSIDLSLGIRGLGLDRIAYVIKKNLRK